MKNDWRYDMSERHKFKGICVHAEDEVCPRYENEKQLWHELVVLKNEKCGRCEETHELLDEHNISREGGIWSVGCGRWSVKARVEMLIKKMSGG